MNKSCCFTGHRKIKVTDEMKFSGTGQTVRMAEIKNIGVINLCNTG